MILRDSLSSAPSTVLCPVVGSNSAQKRMQTMCLQFLDCDLLCIMTMSLESIIWCLYEAQLLYLTSPRQG